MRADTSPGNFWGRGGRRKVKLNRYLPVLRRELHRTGGEALPIGAASLLVVCGSAKENSNQARGRRYFFRVSRKIHRQALGSLMVNGGGYIRWILCTLRGLKCTNRENPERHKLRECIFYIGNDVTCKTYYFHWSYNKYSARY